jgi:23S rRNA (guanine745-N1)-methyltransferase
LRREVVACLRCPVCRSPLAVGDGSVTCASGHAFDVARQGYVSFLAGRPSGLVGDDAEMVAARARFLAGGHFEPLAAELAAHARGAPPGLVVEVGSGTAYYLARALDVLPERVGLGIDLSKQAARRAARAHPRADAIVADARGPLPLAEACAGLVLDVFAPRHGPELRRILRDDGSLVVATPAREHLAELRAALGLLDVDPDKERRVHAALSPWFERASSIPLTWRMTLSRADAASLVSMGPSARHLDRPVAEHVAALADPTPVTVSVVVERWVPRVPAPAPSAG